jgi:hypothetical protein
MGSDCSSEINLRSTNHLHLRRPRTRGRFVYGPGQKRHRAHGAGQQDGNLGHFGISQLRAILTEWSKYLLIQVICLALEKAYLNAVSSLSPFPAFLWTLGEGENILFKQFKWPLASVLPSSLAMHL